MLFHSEKAYQFWTPTVSEAEPDQTGEKYATKYRPVT